MAAKIIKYPTRSRKELARKLSLLFFITCIMVALYLLLGQTISYLQVKRDLKNLKSAVESMEAENERLREEIILLQDKEYLEIQARKHLGMVRPGEIIFLVGEQD